MPYTYEYPRPALTVDCVIFGWDGTRDLKVLLIRRGNEPFKGQWAFPGGFTEPDEDLETSALRELEEETGVKDVFIEQLFTFGDPGRDPRGRVVSVAYFALVNLNEHRVTAADDADDAQWFSINELPELAFDHKKITEKALLRLRGKLRYQPIGFELLPEEFTLSELQMLYETILGVQKINKRNFRTRILKMDVLTEVGMQENVPHRPAKLYAFDSEKYERFMHEDDRFERGAFF